MKLAVSKFCPCCRKYKLLGCFYLNRTRKGGLSVYCSACTLEKAKEKPRSQARKDYERKYRQAHMEQYRRNNRNSGEKIRLEVLRRYSEGKPKCARCNTEDLDVLCIDHVEGGGRKQGMSHRKLYYYLRRMNYPHDYQVLCANCNMRKYRVEGK